MIINDLDGCYIVFDTKNRNMELDTLSIYYILPDIIYLLHTLNPCHLKNTRLQKGSRISSKSGCIIMQLHLFSPHTAHPQKSKYWAGS